MNKYKVIYREAVTVLKDIEVTVMAQSEQEADDKAFDEKYIIDKKTLNEKQVNLLDLYTISIEKL